MIKASKKKKDDRGRVTQFLGTVKRGKGMKIWVIIGQEGKTKREDKKTDKI
jgi:hypothetical protein